MGADPGAPPPLRPVDDPGAFGRVPWAVASHFSPWQAEVGDRRKVSASETDANCTLFPRRCHGAGTGVKCDFQGHLLYTCGFHPKGPGCNQG